MRRTNFYLLFSITLLFLFSACSETGKPIRENKISPADENRLMVSGDQIVNQKGDTVCLRGFGLGGMLHMENFIDGYPANEEAMREGLLEVLGEEKYNCFFNHFRDILGRTKNTCGTGCIQKRFINRYDLNQWCETIKYFKYVFGNLFIS